MTLDWPTIAAFCESLNGVVLKSNFGKPEARVNQRAFAGVSTFDDSFFIALDRDRIATLMAEAPETFWQTAGMSGWPVAHVHYDSPNRALVLEAVREAYDWTIAQPPLRRRAPRG